MVWIDELRRRFSSNAKAAEALHRAWAKTSPKEAQQLSKSSLATKLGDLVKGKVDWWRRRERVTHLLADLLEVDPATLLGGPQSNAGALSFGEFPALPAIQANEEPFHVFRNGWLLHVSLPSDQASHRWVYAPNGFGKSLVRRYLRARGGEDFFTLDAPTLDVAISAVSRPDRFVIIEVDRAGPDDRFALAQLRRHAAYATVLAPYIPEGVENELWTGPENSSGGDIDGWSLRRVRLPDDWRDGFLRWVEGRLMNSTGDTKLSADELLHWLDQHDPEKTLVASPGDLLALASVFHSFPAAAMSLADIARRWRRTLAVSPAWADGGAQLWARRCAPLAFRKLVRRQLREMSLPLSGLSPLDWEQLIPQAIWPVAAGQAPGARVVVGYLCEGGVLRGRAGQLALFPQFAFMGDAMAHVGWLLRSEKVEQWGVMAANEERQPIVDRALGALEDKEFFGVVRSVVQQAGGSTSLALAGAIEAIFHSAAGRLALEGFALPETETATWQQLSTLQLPQLVEDLGWEGTPRPLTRKKLDQRAEWLADAWILSLALPAPDGGIPQSFSWDFPGWAADLQLGTLRSRKFPWTEHRSDSIASASAQIIASLAYRVMLRCSDLQPPEELPRLLLPALALAAPQRNWQLQRKHFADLRFSWEEGWLVETLERMDLKEVEPIVVGLWQSALACSPPDTTVEAAMLEQYKTHELLVPFLLRAVPLEALRSTLEMRGWSNQHDPTRIGRIDLLGIMLPEHRRAVYTRWLRDRDEQRISAWFHARNILERAPEDDFHVVWQVFSPQDASTVSEFAGVLWKRDPQRALQEAARTLSSGSEIAQGWLWGCPKEHLSAMAQLALQLESIPPWLTRWAHEHLTKAGPAAELLYTIIRRAKAP